METITEFKGKNKAGSQIGFIGNGNMSRAIVSGILKSNLFEANDILVSGRNKSIFDDSKFKELGVNLTDNNKELIKTCKIVFLCTKPNALEELAESLTNSKDYADAEEEKFDSTLVSILAGTQMKTLQSTLPMFNSYIRAMPNTPIQVGAGCTALTKLYGVSNSTTELNARVVEIIFSHLGIVEVVDECKFHAVTGLSGSGPAYAYIIIDALSDAGLKQGLPRDLATKFAAQTLLGASKTLLESSSLNPNELKNQVTSSGGTTIYGIHELERHGLRNALIMCVEAATNRSKEMSLN